MNGSRLPFQSTTGTNIGAGGQGFSAGYLRGIMIRNQMEVANKEQKLEEKQAKDKAKLDEMKLLNAQLEAFLKMKEEGREQK